MGMDGETIRRTILEVIAKQQGQGDGILQSKQIIEETARRLGITIAHLPDQQALLTFFGDLFRSGYLSWGYNLSNSSAPHCHVTDLGREALAHLSRDPANPDGYLDHLDQQGTLGPVARSYVEEALRTFNSGCPKACAVMIGVASEAMLLDLRDAIVSRVEAKGERVHSDLAKWQIKTVIDRIGRILSQEKGDMPGDLRERYEYYWSAFVHQLRTARNDSGHPKSVSPVGEETVHAAMLIFPELAALTSELIAWISSET